MTMTTDEVLDILRKHKVRFCLNETNRIRECKTGLCPIAAAYRVSNPEGFEARYGNLRAARVNNMAAAYRGPLELSYSDRCKIVTAADDESDNDIRRALLELFLYKESESE